MSSSGPPSAVGSVFNGGQFCIVRKLGAGNFGTAWIVEDKKAPGGEALVMKQIFIGMLAPDQTVDALKEARILEHLHHPNIIAFHAAFIEKQFVCIVTELCEGGDLHAHLMAVKDKKETVSQAKILDWVVQLTMALDYIHERRILHRDLKTQNIFLKADTGIVKLGDFGISRVLEGTFEVANTFAGTPYYMPPEVLQNLGYNAKSDMWALGCVLFEMCLLRHAFEGESLMGLMYKICEGNLPELPAEYNDDLKTLAKSLLQRDQARRPAAKEILQSPFMKQHIKRFKFALSQQKSLEREQEALRHVGAGARSKRKPQAVSSNKNGGEEDKSSGDDDGGLDYESLTPNIQLSPTPSAPVTPRATGPAAEAASNEDDLAGLTPAQQRLIRKQREADKRAEELKLATTRQHLENHARFAEIRQNKNATSTGLPLATTAMSPRHVSTSSTLSSPPVMSPSSLKTGHLLQDNSNGGASPSLSRPRSRGQEAAEPPRTPVGAQQQQQQRGANTYDDERPIRPMSANSAQAGFSPASTTSSKMSVTLLAQPSRQSSFGQTAQMFSPSQIPETADLADSYYGEDDEFEEDDDDDGNDGTLGTIAEISDLQHFLSQALEGNMEAEEPKPVVVEQVDKRPIGTVGSGTSALREKAKRALGDKFEVVYKYLKEARQNKYPEMSVQKALAKHVANPLDCFIVDQLVYNELFAAS